MPNVSKKFDSQLKMKLIKWTLPKKIHSALLCCLLIFMFTTFSKLGLIIKTSDYEDQNILDGCYHVYLDVGSNIGVQVRKLFEPRLYPKAKVQKIFDHFFGPLELRSESVCAVGFEPNPNHTTYLKELEEAYNDCHWKVYFYTNTAVSDVAGETNFFSSGDFKRFESGGGILSPKISRNSQEANMLRENIKTDTHDDNKAREKTDSSNRDHVLVKMVRLSDFINNVVATRRIPDFSSYLTPRAYTRRSPNVVMKLDIEGSEVDVAPDLFFAGSLQHLDAIMVEWHQFLFFNSTDAGILARETADRFQKIVKILDEHTKTLWKVTSGTRAMKKQKIQSFDLDDETYANSKNPLPQCKP